MRLLGRIIFTLLLVLLPAIIILTTVRIALTPVFISIEYRLPGFPPDEYGFTTEDRLTWAKYSIDYLLGEISHEELSRTRLTDGSALFNQRELSHMLDVRILTTQVLKVWRMLLIFLLSALVFTLASHRKHELLASVKQGALLTIFLIFGVMVFLAINFNQLFTQFHQIFFEGNSWLFLLSDNLIRLFPLRFWRDVFIFIGMASVVISSVILLTPIPSSFHKDSL